MDMAHLDALDREKYLEKVTVGERKPHNDAIFLREYDAAWPALFEREAERIRGALGGKALQIHHVGSTAVSGLCAKPVIDMLLVVTDASDEPGYLPELAAAGYTLRIREPDWFEHRLLKGPDIDVNLHVFSEGCPETLRMLRFRDWLREHEDDRRLYAEAKRALARQTWKHIQNYADAKSAVVAEIMERALSERQDTSGTENNNR